MAGGAGQLRKAGLEVGQVAALCVVRRTALPGALHPRLQLQLHDTLRHDDCTCDFAAGPRLRRSDCAPHECNASATSAH